MDQQLEWTPEVEEVLIEDREKSAPWGIVNERDSKEIVIKFLEGYSPSEISTLVGRSLTYTYTVLRSPEAQEAISEFDQERERGLLDVHRRLDSASVHLLDELLKIAYKGKNEGVRLKAVIEGLGMSGISKIQKIQSLGVKVMVPMEKLHLAQQTIDMEARANGNGGGEKSAGGNGVLDRKSLLQTIVASLTTGGSEGVVISDGEAGGGAETRLETPMQAEPVLPGEGSSGIRPSNGLSTPPIVYAAPAKGPAAAIDRVAAGTLQEHDSKQSIPSVAPNERSESPNPYYKCDSDERTEVAV
jgi:hypothetical protein